jgi:hypothetical protein
MVMTTTLFWWKDAFVDRCPKSSLIANPRVIAGSGLLLGF